jgi:hypothetical protein
MTVTEGRIGATEPATAWWQRMTKDERGGAEGRSHGGA